MDNLSLQFAEAAALQDVDRCTNLEDLKKLTKLLIKGHFQSRGFIATLMKQNLDEMTRSALQNEPSKSCLGQAPAN
jgi:hypothetical protein